MLSLFTQKPKKYFLEPIYNQNSNTFKVQIYKNGQPYSHAQITIQDPERMDIECSQFLNCIKIMYNE